MNNEREIPIFFAIDDSYAPYLSVALLSAVENSCASRNYRAIILNEALSEENKAALADVACDNFKIEFVSMNKGFESIKDVKGNRLRCEQFTLSIYFRLFIASMFPQYDKGIYIDSDIVVLGDLSGLFDIDIGDNLIGACRDRSIENIEPFCRYIDEAVGVKSKDYINSGMLLLNLKKLRELRFDSHFLSLLNEYHFDSVAPDQDYINAICRDKIFYIDECWNTMPNDSMEINPKAKIIHYNLFSKPWCYDNVQYGEHFWRYAQKSHYLEGIQEHKRSFGEEQISNERRCLKNMMENAVKITQSAVTFKKMGERGVRIAL